MNIINAKVALMRVQKFMEVSFHVLKADYRKVLRMVLFSRLRANERCMLHLHYPSIRMSSLGNALLNPGTLCLAFILLCYTACEVLKQAGKFCMSLA